MLTEALQTAGNALLGYFVHYFAMSMEFVSMMNRRRDASNGGRWMGFGISGIALRHQSGAFSVSW